MYNPSLADAAGDRGGGFGGDGKPEIVKQPDTIFIQGLDETTTQQELQEHFGSIGLVKVGNPVVCKIKAENLVLDCWNGVLPAENLFH